MIQKTNDEQLDLFADLIEPTSKILTDAAIAEAFKSGDTFKAVRTAIKNHKAEIIEILALADGVPVEEYKVPSPLGLTVKIMGFVNKPEVQELFTSQGQTNAADVSGSATENIKDGVD